MSPGGGEGETGTRTRPIFYVEKTLTFRQLLFCRREARRGGEGVTGRIERWFRQGGGWPGRQGPQRRGRRQAATRNKKSRTARRWLGRGGRTGAAGDGGEDRQGRGGQQGQVGDRMTTTTTRGDRDQGEDGRAEAQ